MSTFPLFFVVRSKKMTKKEREFQANLIKELKSQYPGCHVLKNDPTYIQGFPDLTILYKDKWAVLECKRDANSTHQPNQDDYVEDLNNMSFSRFIYPENKEEVLRDLQLAFEPSRSSCSSKPK